MGFMRSAFPRVLFKPPSTFKAGSPSDYAMDEVSEKFKKDFRVWIIREEQGFYAILPSARIWDALPGGLRQRTSSSVPAMGAVSLKPA